MLQIIPGGFLKAIEDDSSPQLSGDLDGQSTHSLVNMVDGTFSGVGTFGSLAVDHADTHQFGESDPIDHDLLANWGPNEHIDWTSTDEDLLTTGEGTFGALVVDTNTLVVDAVNHRAGVGTALPLQRFHISDGNTVNAILLATERQIITWQGTPAGNAIIVASSASAAHRGVFKGTRARGTLASPSAVVVNDQVMSFLAEGYDGSARQGAAAVDFFVDGTVTSGNVPMRISFVTGTNSGNRAERLTVKNAGKIGVGITTPTALLDINSDILRLRTAKTPASAGAAGNQGDICWDTSYVYVAVGNNSWKRAALSAW